VAPVLVAEPVVQPSCGRVVRADRKGDPLVAVLDEVFLHRLHQNEADTAGAQLRVNLQVGGQGDARQMPADQGLLRVLQPQVDRAGGTVAEPCEEKHALVFLLARPTIDEESAVAEGRREQRQVCGSGPPHVGLGHLQRLRFSGTSIVPEAARRRPDSVLRPRR
jgi:hypothetical protein